MGKKRMKHLNLPQRMYLKHGSYYYVSLDNKWINLGRDLSIAKIEWAKLDGSNPPQKGMAALINRYMTEVAPLKAPRTYKDNLIEVENLKKVFGKMSPKDIRPHHIGSYLDLRGKKAPTRANREKALLSHILTKGMRWGYLDSNPCFGVTRNKETARTRYISDNEYLKVWQKSNLTIRCLMDMAYLTSQRISDLLDIKHSDISDAGIEFIQQKTGKKLRVAMTDHVRAVVDRCHRIYPKVKSNYLFYSKLGGRYTYGGISAMFRRSVKKAGVIDFHFHDLRAKAITDSKLAGQDAQKLAGHATPAMTERYVRLHTFEDVQPLNPISKNPNKQFLPIWNFRIFIANKLSNK